MWHKNWREQVWSELDQPWDLIVVGGGITGAGVLRHAVAAGLKALLVEGNDFSSGTSSRSSKLIHGGLRYILNKQYRVTQESVRERERLLKEAPHLVTKLGFIFPNFERYYIKNSQINTVISLYDLMAPKWDHHTYSKEMILRECPSLSTDGLMKGYLYYDAAMDDCRIVLRVIREAVAAGGSALNYASVESILRNDKGLACGVVLKDTSVPGGKTVEIQAKCVVNASGPSTDMVRRQIGKAPRLRRLRGSHLIFARERLPLSVALTLLHPGDKRAMFAIPWEGITMIGTTDIDHDPELDQKYTEPFAGKDEIEYLLDAAAVLFPGLNLTVNDTISSFAGLRPIVRGGADSPSQESRAHALWNEDGLITITGGKYTTFRIMARQTVEEVLRYLGKPASLINLKRVIGLPHKLTATNIDQATLDYLAGRHGRDASDLIAAAGAGEMERIGNLPNVWAELRWAARDEGVVHLEDLMLRRVRIGLLLPGGAADQMGRIRTVTQGELGWSDDHWEQEAKAYLNVWKTYYSPAPG
ncbi:MAG: glycerol-3-phosphate dehydrogenase/oxidase [Dehalococcoidia bacterium]|nr:glycerol-3-phosphate dehydrogenase/oxidase [Dehalococcoidia bacterium]